MTDPRVFGRRQSPPRRFPKPGEAPETGLSAAAEAFANSLKAKGGAAPAAARELKAWKSAQARQTLAYTALGLILMAPGLISLALHLSLTLSLGLEAVGLLGNLWLRRARGKRRSDILAWTPQTEA